MIETRRRAKMFVESSICGNLFGDKSLFVLNVNNNVQIWPNCSRLITVRNSAG